MRQSYHVGDVGVTNRVAAVGRVATPIIDDSHDVVEDGGGRAGVDGGLGIDAVEVHGGHGDASVPTALDAAAASLLAQLDDV